MPNPPRLCAPAGTSLAPVPAAPRAFSRSLEGAPPHPGARGPSLPSPAPQPRGSLAPRGTHPPRGGGRPPRPQHGALNFDSLELGSFTRPPPRPPPPRGAPPSLPPSSRLLPRCGRAATVPGTDAAARDSPRALPLGPNGGVGQGGPAAEALPGGPGGFPRPRTREAARAAPSGEEAGAGPAGGAEGRGPGADARGQQPSSLPPGASGTPPRARDSAGPPLGLWVALVRTPVWGETTGNGRRSQPQRPRCAPTIPAAELAVQEPSGGSRGGPGCPDRPASGSLPETRLRAHRGRPSRHPGAPGVPGRRRPASGSGSRLPFRASPQVGRPLAPLPGRPGTPSKLPAVCFNGSANSFVFSLNDFEEAPFQA